jgi:hypothetical protein
MAKQWLKPGDGRRVILPGGHQVADGGEEIEVDLFVLRRLACGDLVATSSSSTAVTPAPRPAPEQESN